MYYIRDGVDKARMGSFLSRWVTERLPLAIKWTIFSRPLRDYLPSVTQFVYVACEAQVSRSGAVGRR
jgi:hypothetical protein